MKQYSRALSFSRYTHLWGSLQLSRINKAPKMTQFDQNASIPLPQRIPKAFWLYGRKFHTLAENAQKIVFPVLKLKNHSDIPPEECLNFSNLGGIRSKSSGGPQLTGQTFLVKLRLICLVLVRILTKTRQISRNLTRKVCPVSWGPPDDLDLIPPRFEKFKHSSGGMSE